MVAGAGGSDSLLLSNALGFLDLDGLLERLADKGQGGDISPHAVRQGPHSNSPAIIVCCMLVPSAVSSSHFKAIPCTTSIGSNPTS